MDKVIIRKYQSDDVDRLVDISLKAWIPIFDFYKKTLGNELFAIIHPDWHADKERQIRMSCNEMPDKVFVAETDGFVVGFVTFSVNYDSSIAEIGNNAVDPAFQGLGIGPMLYEHVFDFLRKTKIRFVKVRTGGDPAHAPARKAYEKAGFHVKLPDVEYYREL